MCIAIHRPGGVHIKKQTLENCFDSNPHGAGFVYPADNGLQIVKGLMDFDTFWKEYRKYPGKPMLIHFRWATHGTRGPEMTHPFGVEIDGVVEYALIHNGIINSAFIGSDANKSDSALFTEKVAAPLLTAMVGRPMPCDVIAKLFAEMVGYNNKILVMDRNGKVLIANESVGVKDLGCWFSNSQYKDIITRSKNRRIHFDTEEEWEKHLEDQRNTHTVYGSCGYQGSYHQRVNGSNNSGNQNYRHSNLPIVYHARLMPKSDCDLSTAEALWMRAQYHQMIADEKFDSDEALIHAGLSVVAADTITTDPETPGSNGKGIKNETVR